MQTLKKQFLASILFVSMLLFCSCSKYPVAKTFSGNSIDNSFNNFVSGGNIVRVDNAVYFVYKTSNVQKAGLYKLTDDKIEKVYPFSDSMNFLTSPRFYQCDDKMYAVEKGDENIYQFNIKNNSFSKSDFSQKIVNFPMYLSKNFDVYYTDDNKVSVKYDNSKVYTIDREATNFYISGKTLFLLNYYGWVYSFDLSTPQSKSRVVTDKSEGSYVNVFSVCGDYIYYDTSHSASEKTLDGFYRYDVKNDEATLVTQKDVFSINHINGQVFFSCKDGVYKDNPNGSPEKLSSLKAEELYIVDDKWLYLYNVGDDSYRMTFDGKTVELIFIN